MITSRKQEVINGATYRFGRGWQLAFKCFFSMVALTVAVGNAHSESYPNKPIRIVVQYSPGGGADIVARLIAEHIGPKLGQTINVENKTGAGGNIGSSYVARSAPDGYTLLLTANSFNLNPMIYKSTGYDPVKDFVPVINVAEGPTLLSVHPSTPYKSLQDFIDAARLNPGSISFGSAGVGSPVHMAMELLILAAGIDVVHIPYKGASRAVVDAVGGHIPVVVGSIASQKASVDAGKLRPLAVSTPKRSSSLPNIPTMAESGFPSAVYLTYLGILAPAGTPADRVARLNKEIAAALLTPATRQVG